LLLDFKSIGLHKYFAIEG